MFLSRPRNSPRAIQQPESRYAAVIPLYRAELTKAEHLRIQETLRHLPKDAVFFVGPGRLVRPFSRSGPYRNIPFITFPERHFGSIRAYNSWMLMPHLYERFSSYEFVLICQTDAFLISPLPLDCPWDFDYLGAPWCPPWVAQWDPMKRQLRGGGPAVLSRELHVGNGGLSLRRTAAFSAPLRLPPLSKIPNEDITISYFSERLGIRLATRDLAERYFMETGASAWRPGSSIPEVYGFHGLNRVNPLLEHALLGHSG
jgi:hypothetical protein